MRTRLRFWTSVFIGACLGLSGGTGLAQQPAAPTASRAEAEIDSAFAAAKLVAKDGPADVKLIDQAVLRFPAGFVFIPIKEAGRIFQAMGNRTGDELLGMVFPTTDANTNSFLVLQYQKSGYIKDDDAKNWDVEELLANLKTGTEEANQERKSRRIPELEVIGWVERPLYDEAAHQLKWSVSTRDKGAVGAVDNGVNYNTYALGREGFISMNLVTDLKLVEAQKPMAAKLLGGLQFDDGKRYADFNSSTDRVAEYGLAALIGGVAAKKLGLFALAAAFIAKFAKVIALGGIAFGAGVFKYLRRKKPSDSKPA